MRRGLQFLASIVLTVASSVAVWAAKHPVPLDPKADTATCIQCHEDKTKGKVVHSAIAKGCTICHEVRVNKETTRIKLTAASASELCITCHSEKDASTIHGKIHAPAVRDCIKCHDPHVAENKNNLLKPAVGDSKETNLCLSCHDTGVNVPKGGSRHAALDMGCGTCHVTHKTGERGKREFDFHLTKDAPQLCIDCHDPKDAALTKAHQGQPIEKSDCLTCHDPHYSKKPMLMVNFTHAPFAAKQCDSCHKPAENGKIVLTKASSKELCLTCHAATAEQIATAKIQHPGAAGDCTDCHNPHGGKSPGFPKPDAVNVCLGCHQDQAEQHKKSHLHQPAFEQGCATCHEPHGGEQIHLLRAKTPNALCLECHGPDRKPVTLEGEHLVTIFGGKVRLPENYFARVPMLPLKYGMGHPVAGHPTSDVMDGKDIDKVKTPINCMTCHQPHSSAEPGLLVKDQVYGMAFCSSCHKTRSFLNAP